MPLIQAMDLLSLLTILLCLVATLHADVPSTLNYQGRVLHNGQPVNGTGHFVFGIYEGESLLWTNTKPVASPLKNPYVPPPEGSSELPPQNIVASDAKALVVRNGVFNVRLGDDTDNNTPIATGVFFNFGGTQRVRTDVKLRVWFSPAAEGPYTKLEPDITFASVPFAHVARVAETVQVGAAADSLLKEGVDTHLSSTAVSPALAAAGYVREIGALVAGNSTSYIYRHSSEPIDRFVLATGAILGTEFTDGQASPVDLGAVAGEGTSIILHLRNLGNRPLTNLSATIDGANASEFSFDLGTTNVPVGDTTTLTITGIAGVEFGHQVAAIHLSAQGVENPFDLDLTKASPLWGKLLNGNALTNEFITAATVDPESRDIIVAGNYGGSTASLDGTVFPNTGSGTNQNVFVSRLSSTGDLRRIQALSATGTSADEVYCVAVDSTGAIYITGDFSGTMTRPIGGNLVANGITDGFVAKYDANGNFVWAQKYGGTSSDSARRLVAAPDGVFLVGQFAGSIDFGLPGGPLVASSTDVFVTRIDSANGNALWANRIGDSRAESVGDAVSRSGGGILVSLLRDNTLHLAAFDAAGSAVGPNPAAAVAAATAEGGALANVPDGIWLAGTENGAGFVMKLSGDGSTVIRRTATDAMVGIKPLDMALDSQGNPITAGSFSGTATLSPSSSPVLMDSRGGSDMFTAKFTAAELALQWAKSGGSQDNDLANSRIGLAIDAQDNLLLGGATRGFVGQNFVISDQGRSIQLDLVGSGANSAGFIVRLTKDE